MVTRSPSKSIIECIIFLKKRNLLNELLGDSLDVSDLEVSYKSNVKTLYPIIKQERRQQGPGTHGPGA